MLHRYSTALSYFFSTLSGLLGLIYCLKHRCTLATASFWIIFVHSLLGIWRWGNPDRGLVCERFYTFTRNLQSLFVLPLIVGQFYLQNGFNQKIAAFHLIIPLITSLILYSRKRTNYLNVIICLSLISYSYVSWITLNLYGFTSIFSYMINYYILHDKSEIFEMPSIDLFNYAQCFFTFFTVRALQDMV